MTIKAGERMPEGKFKIMTDKGPKDLSTVEPVSYTHLTLPTIYSV